MEPSNPVSRETLPIPEHDPTTRGGFGQLQRLLRYARPYGLQVGASVVLMAVVGLLDAFRVLLIGPIFDRVLNPQTRSQDILLFHVPGSDQVVYLQQLVPEHFTNAWT
ncbi:MAG: hypothetical protein ACREMA_14900, partial [Longimicrobiales bacterium]